MNSVEIGFSYNEMVNKTEQKELYNIYGKRGKKIFLAIFFMIVFLQMLVIGSYGINHINDMQADFYFLCGADLILILLICFIFEVGLLFQKMTNFRRFLNDSNLCIRVDEHHIQLTNGACKYSLVRTNRSDYVMGVATIVETDRKIYFLKSAVTYLCYIDKNQLSQEQYAFVTDILKRVYRKQYKKVM